MSMLDLIRKALAEECGVDVGQVTESTNLLDDLGLDSLDLLNASFHLEKACRLKLPVTQWLSEEYGPEPPAVRRFQVGELCRFLESASAS